MPFTKNSMNLKSTNRVVIETRTKKKKMHSGSRENE